MSEAARAAQLLTYLTKPMSWEGNEKPEYLLHPKLVRQAKVGLPNRAACGDSRRRRLPPLMPPSAGAAVCIHKEGGPRGRGELWARLHDHKERHVWRLHLVERTLLPRRHLSLAGRHARWVAPTLRLQRGLLSLAGVATSSLPVRPDRRLAQENKRRARCRWR